MENISFRRRKLPHWRVFDHSYFITIRIHGTIPKNVLIELTNKIREMRDQEEDEIKIQRWQFKKIESILDSCSSDKNFLNISDIGNMILEELENLEEEFHWRISAVTLMPNHIHILCSGEKAKIDLDSFLKRLKGRTAVKANKILKRTGKPFWAQEFFDHWCRTPEKEQSVIEYIKNNPVKAGLVAKPEEWCWTKIK